MVDDLVLIVAFQPVVGFQFVAEDGRACFDVFTDIFLKFLFATIVHNESSNIPAAFHHAHHDNFVFAAGTCDFACAFVFVHIPCFAADERFVYFDFARELRARTHTQCEPDAVIHEPCRLLSNADCPVNFAGADSVFRVHNLPHDHEPFIETDGGIFHHSSGLQGELRSVVFLATVPAAVLLQEQHVI